MIRRFLLGLFLCGIATVTYGQEKEAKVTWDDHVSQIFRQRCVTCHNVNKKSGGLDISTYTNLMLGGSSGDVLEPGAAGSSYLFLLILKKCFQIIYILLQHQNHLRNILLVLQKNI